MQWSAQNLFTIDLSRGETEHELLTALAVASWLLATPVGADSAPSDSVISASEARGFVFGSSVRMIIAKGRACALDASIVESRPDRVVLKIGMYDNNIERLLLLASDVLDRLVPVQELDIEVDVDMSAFDEQVGSVIDEPFVDLDIAVAAG